MLLPADALCNLFLGTGKKLGGDHHIIPLREIPEGSAQELFAGAALVGDGRIIEVHAQFEPALYDLPGMLLIQRPAVLSSSRISETHASHADTGYRKI